MYTEISWSKIFANRPKGKISQRNFRGWPCHPVARLLGNVKIIFANAIQFHKIWKNFAIREKFALYSNVIQSYYIVFAFQATCVHDITNVTSLILIVQLALKYIEKQ